MLVGGEYVNGGEFELASCKLKKETNFQLKPQIYDIVPNQSAKQTMSHDLI